MKPVHPDWQARVRRWMHVRDGELCDLEEDGHLFDTPACACGAIHLPASAAAECAYWGNNERACWNGEHNSDADIIDFIASYIDATKTTTTHTITLEEEDVPDGWDWGSSHRRALADALGRVGVHLDEGTNDWMQGPTVELSWRCDAAWFRAKAAKGSALQDIAVMYADDE
jgi:hypothetical protein